MRCRYLQHWAHLGHRRHLSRLGEHTDSAAYPVVLDIGRLEHTLLWLSEQFPRATLRWLRLELLVATEGALAPWLQGMAAMALLMLGVRAFGCCCCSEKGVCQEASAQALLVLCPLILHRPPRCASETQNKFLFCGGGWLVFLFTW